MNHVERRRSLIVTTCLALALWSPPLPSQSQTSRPRDDARGAGTRDRHDASRREQAEQERLREQQDAMREADEDRARERSEQDNYFRQREAERDARERQLERERSEVEMRNRALREAREREANELERTRRELEEHEAAARRRQAGEASTPRIPAESRSANQGAQQFTRPSSGVSELRCTARPYCPRGSGYGNACKEVNETVAAAAGLSEIIRLCQRANSPEPCGADLPGDPSARSRYLATFAGGCARQCMSVADCSPRAR